ncbi:hypothetical protein C8R47DRAFT_1075808 [Mycena vitilis]|nr:hypothetical protein C8R47DRAFT_1075808 [Mycena vitilis]
MSSAPTRTLRSAATRDLRSTPTHSLRSGDKPREAPAQRRRTIARTSRQSIGRAVPGPSPAPSVQPQGEGPDWRHRWWWCINGPGFVMITRDRNRVEGVVRNLTLGVVFRVTFKGAVAQARQYLAVAPDARLVYALPDGGVQSTDQPAYEAYLKVEKRGSVLCCGRDLSSLLAYMEMIIAPESVLGIPRSPTGVRSHQVNEYQILIVANLGLLSEDQSLTWGRSESVNEDHSLIVANPLSSTVSVFGGRHALHARELSACARLWELHSLLLLHLAQFLELFTKSFGDSQGAWKCLEVDQEVPWEWHFDSDVDHHYLAISLSLHGSYHWSPREACQDVVRGQARISSTLSRTVTICAACTDCTADVRPPSNLEELRRKSREGMARRRARLSPEEALQYRNTAREDGARYRAENREMLAQRAFIRRASPRRALTYHARREAIARIGYDAWSAKYKQRHERPIPAVLEVEFGVSASPNTAETPVDAPSETSEAPPSSASFAPRRRLPACGRDSLSRLIANTRKQGSSGLFDVGPPPSDLCLGPPLDLVCSELRGEERRRRRRVGISSSYDRVKAWLPNADDIDTS